VPPISRPQEAIALPNPGIREATPKEKKVRRIAGEPTGTGPASKIEIGKREKSWQETPSLKSVAPLKNCSQSISALACFF
jgi:hypothetical protein